MSGFKQWGRAAALGALCSALAGCANIGYFVQAAHGQAALLSSARPVDEVMASPDESPALKARLAKAKEIRAFAVSALGLPDNGSYKTYADAKRPFVLWNVVAAPELSLKPKQWCFPVSGCVSYRGYYDKRDAERMGRELQAQGYDVEVGGVAAYSTLGWFNDPLISTFINRPEADLAGLIFHELAHQTVYAPGDSAFNESFATAVERAGVERWLEEKAGPAERVARGARMERDEQFLKMLVARRNNLKALYASKTSDQLKREGKKRELAALKEDYKALRERWGGYSGYDRWFSKEPSNAGLAAVATYHDGVPGFREMMRDAGSMPEFYARAKRLAALSKEKRSAELEKWGERAKARDVRAQGQEGTEGAVGRP